MNIVEQKLRERFLNPELYSVFWDDEVATFLLFNLSGQIVGYQNYRWDATKDRQNDPRESKYFTYAPKDRIAVFGMESLYFRNDLLFICEGVFDAVRLHNLGLPAIAVLCNNPVTLRSWLRILARKIIVVCEGDKAGLELMSMGLPKKEDPTNASRRIHVPAPEVDEVVFLDEGLDLGDMTDEQIQEKFKKWL